MKIVNIRNENQPHPTKACTGEEIIIARGKDRVLRLVPIRRRKGPRKLGILKGKLVVGAEFFEPLPPEELAA